MKATFETINSVQRRVKIEIPANLVNEAFDKIYQDLRKKAAINGFRKGKAPIGMIKKMYGDSVATDVVDKLINGNLFTALQDEKINPIASPVIEEAGLPKTDEVYMFTAVVDIMPEIKLKDYKSMKVDVHKYVIKDADVDREIEMLQKKAASTTAAADDAVAAIGNLATITHTGTIEGVERPELKGENVQIELGGGQMLEDIDKAIVGMKAGDSKDIEVTMPDSIPDETIAKKKATFVVNLESLQTMTLPEFNDEFAKDNNFDTASELKEDIKKQLNQQAEKSRRAELENNLLTTLRKDNEVEVPPAMVDNVIDSMIDDMFKGQEGAADAKKDQATRDNFKAGAKDKVLNSLFLMEIVKAEKVEVTDEDMTTHVGEMLGGASDQNKDLIKQLIASNGAQIKESLIFTKAMDVLIDSATVKEID